MLKTYKEKKDCFYLKFDKINSIINLNNCNYYKRMDHFLETGPYNEFKKKSIIEEKSKFLVKI